MDEKTPEPETPFLDVVVQNGNGADNGNGTENGNGTQNGNDTEYGNGTEEHKTKPEELTKKTKIIITVFIFTAMTFLGMGANLLGPSLLDLEYQTGSTTKTISPVFNWRYGGYFLGTLITGPIIDRFDETLYLGIAHMGLGISTAIMPLCKILSTLFVTGIFVGLTQSCNTVTMSAVLIKLWGEASDPFQQALHFFVALGGSISPQLLKPFMIDHTKILHHTPTNDASNITEYSEQNVTTTTGAPAWDVLPGGIILEHENTLDNSPIEVRIQYGWFIVAVGMIGSAIFGLTVFAIVLKCKYRKEVVKKSAKKANGKVLIQGRGKLMLLALYTLLAFLHGGLEETFWGMLMTFAVKHLNYSKSVGANMVTMFWVTATITRALSVVICKYVKPVIFLAVEINLILFGMLLLAFTVNVHWVLPWICVAIAGVGVSSIMPTIVNWAKNTITLQGKETAIIFAGFACMKMLSPALLGYLFEVHTGMWFVYILILYSSLALLTYLAISFLTIFLKRKMRRSHDMPMSEAATDQL